MIVSFLGYKGGVGKTTSCVNVAGFLRKAGKSVLVVDLDPQANATSALGIDMSSVELGINDAVDPTEGILEGPEGIHILSSKGERVEQIPDLDLEYDFVMIDTPPSSKEITGAIASVSDVSFACFDCGILALESFRYLGIKAENAIVCKYRWLTDREIRDDIGRKFRTVFTVPYDQRIIRAQILGRTIAYAYPRSRAAPAYRKIADWLLH